MADQFQPKPEHKFTFGLWTVGNVGRDPFGKPVGSDLRQGLFTLPAIYYAEAHPDDADMKALLNGNARDPGTISRVVAAVRTSGAMDETLREARVFVAQGQLALERLPPSPYAAALSAVAHYIADRNL